MRADDLQDWAGSDERPARLGRGALRWAAQWRRWLRRVPSSRGFAVLRLRPVPDQREGAAVLVLDQVREDRRREGGVVEPDLVVLATALLGRLGPAAPSSTAPA